MPLPAAPQALAFHALRLGYGFLWLWSGTVKMKDPGAFALAVRNYELLGDPWVAAAALFIPALECVAALAVIFRRGAAGALALLWASLAVFTLAIAVSWARGLDIECGCFGLGGSALNYPVKLLQNLALLAAGGWLWKQELRVPAALTA